MVPVLLTERLCLRGFTLDDFPAYAARWARPEMYRFGGAPLCEEDAWVRFLRVPGHWTLMGFGYWWIEARDTGAPIGEGGFQEARRDIVPALLGIPEAGWAVAPDAQGHGYASEAMLAIVEWADRAFAGKRTACIINPQNLPSIGVALRCGFTEAARTLHRGNPTIVFHRH